MGKARWTGLLLIAVLVVAATAHADGDALLIASWNLMKLGEESPVAARAEVIKLFDLVAVQEVLALSGLDRLTEQLRCLTGVDWSYVASPRVGDGNASEYYAFIYRTDRVLHVAGAGGAYPEAAPTEFSREPFFASFRAGAFDFTLITVHITWGASASERTEECQRLAEVWSYVQALDPVENDVILVGDFNRDRPTHSAFDPLWELGLVPVLESGGTRTTFGRTAWGGSFYDNLWIDRSHTGTEITDVYGAGTPLENTLGRGCPDTLRDASDHCPVWAAFVTTHDDDP